MFSVWTKLTKKIILTIPTLIVCTSKCIFIVLGGAYNPGAYNPGAYNPGAYNPAGHGAPVPAGVDPHSCPNYPFCH